jgi:hypothetical protein
LDDGGQGGDLLVEDDDNARKSSIRRKTRSTMLVAVKTRLKQASRRRARNRKTHVARKLKRRRFAYLRSS